MNLSIVVPLYNEENRFSEFFPQLHGFIAQMSDIKKFEILCVNDGSKDRTKKIVEKHRKNYSGLRLINVYKNKGKGHALRTGVREAQGDIIIFTDIDLSADISTIPKLISYIEKGADFVISSRLLKRSRVAKRQNIVRESMGKVYTQFTKRFLGLPYVDMTCGLKGGKRASMKKVFSKMRINRWSFDPEMLFIAKKYSMKVKEHPVVWKNNDQSKVNVIVDAVRSFKELLDIRLNDVLGRYD